MRTNPEASKLTLQQRIKGLPPTVIVYLAACLLFFILSLFLPSFRTISQIFTVITLASFLGMASAGQTAVIISGGIDMSVGALISVGDVMTNQLTQGANSQWPALLLIFFIAAVIGALNGIGIGILKIPPLIMTLGIGTIVSGALLVWTNGSPQGTPPPWIVGLTQSRWLGIPSLIFIWLIMIVIVISILTCTSFGKKIFAIGSNVVAANLSGIHVPRTTVYIYILSALCSAATGILLAGYTGGGYLDIGSAYLFPSIAAVVIGGTSILGGKGGYAGTVAGAIIVTTIDSMLQIVHIAEAGRNIINGVIILLLLSIYGRKRNAGK